MKKICDYVIIEGQEYAVSTISNQSIFDSIIETMVFESHNQEVTNWCDLYARSYNSWDEAKEGHEDIVNNLVQYLD